jgi:hypothetical protein
MANAIHGVLQAMDNLANAPVLLTARLLQPAPPRQHTQSAADLTPPKVVKRKRRLTLPLDEVSPEVSGRTKWYGKRVVRQRTSEQLQSPLMRLPAELREQIWRYVILNSTGRYDSTTGDAIEIHWRSAGYGRGRARASYALPPEHGKDQALYLSGALSLLCSCRMM